MRYSKKIFYFFCALAILLSNIMCAAVAYNYANLQCGIAHMGFSAPASTAFLLAIPFVIGIAVCIILAVICFKKAARK